MAGTEQSPAAHLLLLLLLAHNCSAPAPGRAGEKTLRRMLCEETLLI